MVLFWRIKVIFTFRKTNKQEILDLFIKTPYPLIPFSLFLSTFNAMSTPTEKHIATLMIHSIIFDCLIVGWGFSISTFSKITRFSLIKRLRKNLNDVIYVNYCKFNTKRSAMKKFFFYNFIWNFHSLRTFKKIIPVN